ncbi:MAG: hypothetical protein WCB09_11560, partial [Methylocella sp.]
HASQCRYRWQSRPWMAPFAGDLRRPPFLARSCREGAIHPISLIVAASINAHAVQKSKNQKRQKDAYDCVKQAFLPKDHVSNAPFESSAGAGAAALFANCNSAP